MVLTDAVGRTTQHEAREARARINTRDAGTLL